LTPFAECGILSPLMSTDWTGRRILKELCDAPRRRQILLTFWKEGEDDARNLVVAALARNLNFRLDSIRKAPPEKKADLLAMQLHVPQFEEPLELALMLWHTSHARELLSAFLDAWKIPHVDGSIEAEEYTVPKPADVTKAAATLGKSYPVEDIILYLATAGLLMGHEEPAWREATWPEVERLRSGGGAPPAASAAPPKSAAPPAATTAKSKPAAPSKPSAKSAPAPPAKKGAGAKGATGTRKSRG
jgi:hypothetical protein